MKKFFKIKTICFLLLTIYCVVSSHLTLAHKKHTKHKKSITHTKPVTQKVTPPKKDLIIKHAITRTISLNELPDYPTYPGPVKTLIQESLSLAGKNLTYQYGSSEPKNGGMDCSGTIYYLLRHVANSNAPRQANEMYTWVEKEGKIHYTQKDDTLQSPAFKDLKPGDLLFWSGTYAIHRFPNITHVMLYLGKDKNQQPLMFGASDGRTYKNTKMRGVSVFDFKLPRKNEKARFEAYGCIPNINC